MTPQFDELTAVAAKLGLRLRALVKREGDRWEAQVNCGQADDQWRRTGAFPVWRGQGDTASTALDAATHSALHYWQWSLRASDRTGGAQI